MNYTFPETIFVDCATIERQVEHVQEEYIEFMREFANRRMGEADIEAMDIYHSLETYFRMRGKAGIDVGEVVSLTQRKNKERGYYSESKTG